MFKKHLRFIVKEISEYMEDGVPMAVIGRAADLCPSTITKLLDGDTHEPRYSTIWKLAKLVGLEIELEKSRTKVAKTTKRKKAA